MANGIALTIDGTVDTELVQAKQIEVWETWGEPSRFQLSYALDISTGDLPLLIDERLAAGREVGIIATSAKAEHCLIKGPVHGQQIRLKHGGVGSELQVLGSDNLIKLAREDKAVQWADVSDADAVTSILAGYGFIPEVTSSAASHYVDKHSLIQRSNDLSFVRKLARRNGYLFWLRADASGLETAHFKPADLAGEAAHELIINLDDANIDELSLSWDVERPDQVSAQQLDLNNLSVLNSELSETDHALLGSETMASIRGASYLEHLHPVVDDAGDLDARGQGLLSESNWFVKGFCLASVTRLGAIIRSHELINLRGAGSRHSGYYFVCGVRHLIDSEKHLMEIHLMRNAW